MKIKELYNKAKETKIGESCICPSCKTSFVKTNYQQVFCKTKPKTQCKDKYWNTIDENKRNNTTRISPASLIYLASKSLILDSKQRIIDKEDRLQLELESDGSWDERQCYVSRCEWCECLICRCEN